MPVTQPVASEPKSSWFSSITAFWFGTKANSKPETSKVDDDEHDSAISLSDPDPPQFVYSGSFVPTEQIRLLILKSPSEANPNIIEGTLIHADLQTQPEYEALSYEWGDTEADRELILDGKLFRVRDNLWQALRNLRIKTDRKLWVDAVCVDQNNIGERNHQVAQMSQIFRGAKVVLIWLGSVIEKSPSASAAIGAMRHRTYLDWRVTDLSLGQLWKPLVDFNTHSYFGRLWIVQEVVLAQKLQIHCDGNHAEWQNFEQMCDYLCDKLKHHSKTLPLLQSSVPYELLHQRRLRRKGDPPSLLPLLVTCRYSLCRDPRDKIFGLLGLVDNLYIDPRNHPRNRPNTAWADPEENRDIRADYRRSIFEVYDDMIHFQHNRLLGKWFAKYCEASTLAKMNTLAFSEYLVQYMSHKAVSYPFHGDLHQLALASMRHEEKLVRVVGHTACRVLSIGPSAKAVLQNDSTFDTWINNFQTSDPPAEFQLKYDRRALMGMIRMNCRTMEEFPKVIPIDSGSSYAVNFCYEYNEQLTTKTDGDKTPSVDGNHADDEAKDMHLYVANDGELGLGPSNMKKGDLICRFPNSPSILAIIRMDGSIKYKIIGRALKGLGNLRTIQQPPAKERRFAFYLDIITLFLLTR